MKTGMKRDEIQTVWVLSTADVSTAPGSTEPYYLIQEFAENWETHVFAPLSGDINSAQEHRLPVASIAAVVLFNTILAPYFVWQAIRYPPDVVYVYRNIFVPALIAKLLTDTIIIYDIRVDPYQQPKEFDKYNPQGLLFNILLYVMKTLHQYALPRADGVVTLSQPLADRLCADYGVSAEKIRLIPLAADPKRLTPTSQTSEPLHVVYVGALQQFRGISDLVKALATLEPELRSKVQLDLYGEADEEFIESIEDLALNGPTLNWHGYVEHEQLIKEVSKCDVAASPLPPLDSFEVSSPAKIYEYLALGLPIVATDITPHRSILTEDCCILVPPGETEAMAEAFRRVLKDDEYRLSLSNGARRKSLNNTWSNRFSDLCGYIEEWS